ncbi:MAG: hypothetical protein IKX74_01350 [Erysipelotrichaceae bacterium]|nr:hypothetical protein [Erysipelotrichaceae bacterium]MBR5048284.1 hypothetical protein [Erysipelotrichaceae bacterium]
MSYTELWEKLKTSIWLYVIILVAVLLLVLVLVIVSRRKKLQKRIEQGQILINGLKSHPFAVDIAKTDAIARVNANVRDTAFQCKKDFEEIQNNIKDIVVNLQDANELLTASKFKLCAQKLDENEQLIQQTELLTEKLDGVLANVLNQSTIQRKRINELKNEFHQIKSMINDNPNNYTFCWEALDRLTNGISHQFSDFESVMDASMYENATEIAENIGVSIEDLNALVQKLPEVIQMSRNTLPGRINECRNEATLLESQGAYIGHLNINGNLETLNASLDEILTKIKNCELEGIDDLLIDCDTRINQISSNLADEKNAFRDLVVCQENCQSRLESVRKTLEQVRDNFLADFDRYGLNDLSGQFQDTQNRYQEANGAYESLLTAQNCGSIPATTLIITFKEVENDIMECQKQAREIAGKLETTRTSELRVQELMSRFVVVLNESKASIKLSKLPNISSKYDQDIARSEQYIADINEQLQQPSVDIDRLNETINEAQKLIISLYKNVNSLISTAQEIEEFIITCNKYRPYYPDVDASLYSAEVCYRNGEYTKACKMAVSALSSVDPELASQLSESIDKKIAMQKEA